MDIKKQVEGEIIFLMQPKEKNFGIQNMEMVMDQV